MMRHPLSNLQMAHFLIYFLYIIGMQIEKLASSLVWRFESSILYPKKKKSIWCRMEMSKQEIFPLQNWYQS